MSFAAFAEDATAMYAVERLLTIIGEAARRLSDQFRVEHPQFAWRRIIGLRNLLAHQYLNDIEHETIWEIVSVDIPALIEQADKTGLLGG